MCGPAAEQVNPESTTAISNHFMADEGIWLNAIPIYGSTMDKRELGSSLEPYLGRSVTSWAISPWRQIKVTNPTN
jgi:hypothetical protein